MTNGMFIQPKNTMPEIKSFYAFVSVDKEDGNEGVCGYYHPGIGMLPMFAADEVRLEELKPVAQRIAIASDLTIRLVKFTNREEIEVIRPSDGSQPAA